MPIPRSLLSTKPNTFPTILTQSQLLVSLCLYFVAVQHQDKTNDKIFHNRSIYSSILYSVRPGDDKNKAGYEATATEPNQTANRPNYANRANGDDDDEEEDPYQTDGDSDADYDGYSSPDSDDMPGFRNM